MAAKKKLTTRAAIEKVLADNGGKMRVPEIIAAAVPLTNLGGKTPGQVVYSALYSDAKKPESVFKQTGRGEFRLDKKAIERRDSAAAENQASKEEPKPSRSSKAKTAFETSEATEPVEPSAA